MADTAEPVQGQALGVTKDKAKAPESAHEFSSLRHEFNYYSRFLQPLAATLPTVQERTTAAQWCLVLSASRSSAHNEYLKQLLVCCTLGRLLGVFATPPASPCLPPLPAYHSVAWLTRRARALEQEQRSGAGEPTAAKASAKEAVEKEGEKQDAKEADAGAGPAEAADAKTDAKADADADRKDGVADDGVQPVQVEVSAGGTQFLAVQDNREAESHFYLAFSPEPLSCWVGAVESAVPAVQVVPPDQPSGPSGASGATGGSGSVPWLSSHEGEGIGWLLHNPGFLSLPSAERPNSSLWQDASLGDPYAEYGEGTAVSEAGLPLEAEAVAEPQATVWVPDQWGELREVPLEAVCGEAWRPAEQVPQAWAGRRRQQQRRSPGPTYGPHQ